MNSSILIKDSIPMLFMISTALVLQGLIIVDLGPMKLFLIICSFKNGALRTQFNFSILKLSSLSLVSNAKTFDSGSPKNDIIMEV